MDPCGDRRRVHVLGRDDVQDDQVVLRLPDFGDARFLGRGVADLRRAAAEPGDEPEGCAGDDERGQHTGGECDCDGAHADVFVRKAMKLSP
jgi:hypothetical protein